MAAFKPEVHVSKLVDKIGTKVQRLCKCFRGPAVQLDCQKCCTTKPEVRNPIYKSNMAAFKPEVPISKLVDKIGTNVQWLCKCFRGPATQWDYNKCCTTKPEVRKSNMAAFKPEVPISKHV